MTHLVALIFATADSQTTITREGVRMADMKQTLRELVARHGVPVNATLYVQQEQPRKVVFRGLLSSLTL